MKHWDLAAAVRLVWASYLWLASATAPLLAAVLYAWNLAQDGLSVFDGSAGFWLLIVAVVFAVFALGGGVVALPFTYVLGWFLRRSESKTVHVVAHSALAGVLAAVLMHLFAMTEDIDGRGMQLAVAVAAGAAAAIARWRQLHPKAAAPATAPSHP
jgi:hypothetical protein